MPIKKMEPLDIAWLAGLMEGEASIGAWKSNQNRGEIASNGRKYARVEISSVDQDIIERLYELTGIGKVHKQISEGSKGNNKRCNTWRVAQAEDVIHLLCTVASYGYFSEHRRTQILEATEVASETIRRKQSGESTSRKKKPEEPLD